MKKNVYYPKPWCYSFKPHMIEHTVEETAPGGLLSCIASIRQISRQVAYPAASSCS